MYYYALFCRRFLIWFDWLINYLFIIYYFKFWSRWKGEEKIPPWNRDPRVLFHYPMLKYSVAQPPYKKKKKIYFWRRFFWGRSYACFKHSNLFKVNGPGTHNLTTTTRTHTRTHAPHTPKRNAKRTTPPRLPQKPYHTTQAPPHETNRPKWPKSRNRKWFFNFKQQQQQQKKKKKK